MGLLDKFKKKPKKNNDEEKTVGPILIDLLSRYIGPARQRQLIFGEQVVRNRNWYVDLSRGSITFGEDEYPVQLLGTESETAGTWLWGFLNKSGFPEAVVKDSEYAYNFCARAAELAVAEPELTDFVNGHNIASIAVASRNDKVCYYRCPYDGGAAFVIVENMPESVFAPIKAERVISIISELITQLSVNHIQLVRSLMEINCAEMEETENKLIGQYADGTNLSVSFDDQGRIASMNAMLSANQSQTEPDEEPHADNNQAHITLYTVIGEFSRVKKALKEKFADMTKAIVDAETDTPGIENFDIRLHDDSEFSIYLNTNQELVGRHIAGMYSFFAEVECENQKLHENVLYQISVFNCVAGVSFMLDGNEFRTNYIINTMFEVAKEITGIILMPDKSLFSDEGKLIFSIDGKSDYEEYTPVGNADFLDSKAEETNTDAARRERSINALIEKGIPYMPSLRTTVMESEATPRSTEEMARRLFGVFAVCVYSEARSCGESWEESQKYLDRMNEIVGNCLESIITLEEKAFLADKVPEPRELAKFGWRYECCHVLLWALGIIDELGYPEKICDVSNMGKIIWRQESLEQFLKSAKPRPSVELLDAADLMLRYDWACVDARIKKLESPAGLNEGVVQEWHYAFNWLIGANGGADWDNISINT